MKNLKTYITSLCILILLLISGCGGSQSGTDQMQPIVRVEPVLVRSAHITAFNAQYIERTLARLYFNVSGSFYNDGDIDLNSAHYQISGEDFYWKWYPLKVVIINIPRGTRYSFTQDVTALMSEILLVTGPNLPVDYRLKVEIRDKDGTTLDTKYVTIVVI